MFQIDLFLWKLLKPFPFYSIIRRVVTTPFLIRLHDGPVDCSRRSETGLKYFLAECGFDIEKIKTGSWGNPECPHYKSIFMGQVLPLNTYIRKRPKISIGCMGYCSKMKSPVPV